VDGQLNIRPNSQTSKVNALAIAAGGKLDLSNNALIVDYSGASPLLSVRAAIVNGSLGSSALTAQTAIGYAEASVVLAPGGEPFLGQDADGTSILVRYTLGGDANLDGRSGSRIWWRWRSTTTRSAGRCGRTATSTTTATSGFRTS
jgi:hypothetical protein